MGSYRDNDFEKYSVNVGIINFNFGIYLLEGFKKMPDLRQRILTITHNLSFRKKLGEPLEKVLDNHRTEAVKDEHGFMKTKEGENILEFLNNTSYLPIINNGKVFSWYPYEITLTPSDDDFDFFFSLRLAQTKLQEVDEFLVYQLVNSFQNNETKFIRFLKINLREYEKKFYSQKYIDTVNEWIADKEKKKAEEPEPVVQLKNSKSQLEGITNKIICTADSNTIENYFHRLVSHNVLTEEEVDHILCYSFKVFDTVVPKKRFTPLLVSKGEMMKFVHEFFTNHCYSRKDANQWIQLILMDSMTMFDRPDSSDKEILEYIKDNWSKYPAKYRFRRT